VASIGRYGPYVSHDGKYANLGSTEEVFTVGANRAITLLAEAKEKSGRRTSSALREFEHPEGGAIKVMSGRYGPYVTHNKVNATLPKGVTPEEVTVEQAVELLAQKAASGKPAKKKAAPKKAASPKKGSTAKRSTTKASKKEAST